MSVCIYAVHSNDLYEGTCLFFFCLKINILLCLFYECTNICDCTEILSKLALLQYVLLFTQIKYMNAKGGRRVRASCLKCELLTCDVCTLFSSFSVRFCLFDIEMWPHHFFLDKISSLFSAETFPAISFFPFFIRWFSRLNAFSRRADKQITFFLFFSLTYFSFLDKRLRIPNDIRFKNSNRK